MEEPNPLAETVLSLLVEKIPENARDRVLEGIKTKPTLAKIDFVKTLLSVGIDLKPAQAAGQLPAPGTPAKPKGFFERSPPAFEAQKKAEHRY